MYPRQGISESDQPLIFRPVSISASVRERSKIATETDSRMPERAERELSNNGAVGGDVRRIKADAGKKTLQCSVAVPEKVLLVESTTRFVHQAWLKNAGVRKSHGLVLAIVFRQAEARVRRNYRTRCVGVSGGVVADVDVILIAEVMIKPQGTRIKRVSSRQFRLKTRNAPIRRVDRCAHPDVGKIGGDHFLHRRIQEPGGNLDELQTRAAHRVVGNFLRGQRLHLPGRLACCASSSPAKLPVHSAGFGIFVD